MRLQGPDTDELTGLALEDLMALADVDLRGMARAARVPMAEVRRWLRDGVPTHPAEIRDRVDEILHARPIEGEWRLDGRHLVHVATGRRVVADYGPSLSR